MDRFLSVTLFLLAMLCLTGGVLLLLADFIEYLQLGRWRLDSLLDAAYQLNLIRARWFLTSDFAGTVRILLMNVPAFAALLFITPLAWWLSQRFGCR